MAERVPVPRDTTLDADVARLTAWSAEMRRVHTRLRDAVALARDEVEARGGAAADAALADPLLVCWGMCVALSGHHEGEDRVLFPAVVAAHPELADVVRDLGRDHSMLEHLLAGLRTAATRGDSALALLQHLDGIEAVMETHFRYEERMLLPLLETLPLTAAVDAALGPIAG